MTAYKCIYLSSMLGPKRLSIQVSLRKCKIKILSRNILKIFLIISPSDELYFMVRRLFKDPWVSPNSMSGNEVSSELVKLCTNKNVLEFGSGGSTLLIGKVSKRLISIESDQKFARKMRKLIETMGLNNTQLIYANIGPTKSFGQPIEFISFFFRRKYQHYTGDLHNSIIDDEQLANVVFVDGRFRVWCAIECIRSFTNDFTLVFDDYLSRPEYQSLSNVLGNPYQIIGDTAFFFVGAGSIKKEELLIFEVYKYDFR